MRAAGKAGGHRVRRGLPAAGRIARGGGDLAFRAVDRARRDAHEQRQPAAAGLCAGRSRDRDNAAPEDRRRRQAHVAARFCRGADRAVCEDGRGKQLHLSVGESRREPRALREVLPGRGGGQRLPTVPEPVRPAAGLDRQRHQQPVYGDGVPGQPLHPGHRARRDQVPAAQRQCLDDAERCADLDRQRLLRRHGAARSRAPSGGSAGRSRGTGTRSSSTSSGRRSRSSARAKLIWQADPQLRFNAAGGYENNRFPFVTTKGRFTGAASSGRRPSG